MKNNIYLKRLFKKAGIIAICYCLICISFLLFACDDIPVVESTDITPAESSESETPENSEAEAETEEESPEEETPAEETEEETEEQPQEEAETGEITINVYYSDQMAQYLIAESRIIPAENKFIGALYELMKKPIDSTLEPLVPGTAIINSVIVEDGNAKVDFSQEFLDDRFISDTVDRLLVGSIANTLTQFSEINSITLYIDGEKLDNLGGLDISEPIYRKNDLIKDNQG